MQNKTFHGGSMDIFWNSAFKINAVFAISGFLSAFVEAHKLTVFKAYSCKVCHFENDAKRCQNNLVFV